MKDKMMVLGKLIRETISSMEDRQKVIVFNTNTEEEAKAKRREALDYVMSQLNEMRRFI